MRVYTLSFPLQSALAAALRFGARAPPPKTAEDITSSTVKSKNEEKQMKYFIDTHDKAKGSFPGDNMTEEDFIRIYQKFEKALEEVGGADLGAHVNVKARKAFCFTKGPDSDAIRRAHEKLNFPFDSITEVRRVTGVDLRPELSECFHPDKVIK
jgi:uncharacterized protein DUF4242